MTQKLKTDQSQKIADAALSLAEKLGWGAVTLKSVAQKARLPLKTVEAAFSDTWGILVYVLKKLEKDTNATVKKSLGKNWRENLFEILMTRAELAKKNRKAFKSVPKALAQHPRGARHMVRPFYSTLTGMLELAGLKKSKCSPLHLLAFGALYLSLVEVWMKDDTRDLSRTMAAVDKRLELFERLLDFKLDLSSRTK